MSGSDLDGVDTLPRDSGGLEILDRPRCLELLAGAPLGRIVFTDAALPAIQPVNFVVHDGAVIVRTSPESRLASAARGAVVAFEVDDFDADHRTGWSVVLLGHARHITDPEHLARLRGLPLRPWVPGTRDRYIRISIDVINGRKIT